MISVDVDKVVIYNHRSPRDTAGAWGALFKWLDGPKSIVAPPKRIPRRHGPVRRDQ